MDLFFICVVNCHFEDQNRTWHLEDNQSYLNWLFSHHGAGRQHHKKIGLSLL